jgi:hypothetical protein
VFHALCDFVDAVHLTHRRRLGRIILDVDLSLLTIKVLSSFEPVMVIEVFSASSLTKAVWRSVSATFLAGSCGVDAAIARRRCRLSRRWLAAVRAPVSPAAYGAAGPSGNNRMASPG